MAITLDGTLGITSPAETVQGALTTTGNTILGDATTDTLTVGVTGIVKDASGNVGIGTASPVEKLTVNGGVIVTGAYNGVANGGAINLSYITGTSTGSIYALDPNVAWKILEIGGSTVITSTNGTERMRLDSSGNLLVGGTSQAISSRVSIESTSTKLILRDTNATAGKFWRFDADGNNSVIIYNQNSAGVWIGDGGTAWNSSSDETLKADLLSIKDAIQKTLTLRAVTGRFKTDEIGVSRSFLIAQDVQKVLPEAVSISPTGTLGLAYTDVIPLLVASIQEQQALILALTARLEKLENNK